MRVIPVLAAYADPHGYLAVWCVHCRTWHHHGQTEGHRVAHCFNNRSPYLEGGYILRHVGAWQGQRKTPRLNEPLEYKGQ
jgi:hypothetical protein